MRRCPALTRRVHKRGLRGIRILCLPRVRMKVHRDQGWAKVEGPKTAGWEKEVWKDGVGPWANALGQRALGTMRLGISNSTSSTAGRLEETLGQVRITARTT